MCLNAMGASMRSLVNVIQLLRLHGIVVGENCGSIPTLTKMGISMSTSMHTRVCDHVKSSPDPVVVMADGSADICK